MEAPKVAAGLVAAEAVAEATVVLMAAAQAVREADEAGRTAAAEVMVASVAMAADSEVEVMEAVWVEMAAVVV